MLPAKVDEVRLADFLGRFSDLVREHDGWVVPCPAHDDDSPSLRIALNNDNALLLHCRAGCAKANVLQALELTEAALYRVDTSGIETLKPTSTADVSDLTLADRAALAAYIDRAKMFLSADGGKPGLEYLTSRFGLTPAHIQALDLGMDPGNLPTGALHLSPTHYRADPRIVVPFFDFDGIPVGLQARALTKSAGTRWSGPTNPAHGAWAKFGYFKADSGLPEVIITEGPGDALTTVAVGYDALLIRGASLVNNPDLVKRIGTHLTGRRIVVAGDNDPAGQAFTQRVCEVLAAEKLDTHRLTLPAQINDVTAWREADPASFPQLFQQAVQTAPKYGEDAVLFDRLSSHLSTIITDVENARALLRFIQIDGCDVRYTAANGFMVYLGHNHGTWVQDKEVWVRNYAQRAGTFIQQEALEEIHRVERQLTSVADEALRTRLADTAMKIRKKVHSPSNVGYIMSTRGIDSMIKELKALDGVSIDYTIFDANPELLAVANGVVNLADGSIMPYSDKTKTYYLSRRVDTIYNPDAVCPRWDKFMLEISNDRPELADYLQRLIGYGITGYNTEHVIAIMLGGGSNGKSVFMDTIFTIFGSQAVITPFSTFERKDSSGGASPDIAKMAGARLVMAAEGDADRPMAEALLKRLSGGDPVSARYLYRDDFTFRPVALICLITNKPPLFRGQDNGIWRRIHKIPFDRTFSGAEVDKYLQAKFLGHKYPSNAASPHDNLGDGRQGILTWAIKGAKLWMESGLNTPDLIKNATADYREMQDQLGEFFDMYLVKEEDRTAKIKTADVWKLYSIDYATAMGLSSKDKWGKKTFEMAMVERGYAIDKGAGGHRYYIGCRSKTAKDYAAERDLPFAPPTTAFTPVTFSTPT